LTFEGFNNNYLHMLSILGIIALLVLQGGGDRYKDKKITPYPALYWDKLGEEIVQCHLCPWRCVLEPGERGRCRVKENRRGKLITLVYGLTCSIHSDPIEKKPLFHFLPKSFALSIATAGCNLRCIFCQNWQISQRPPEKTQNIWLPPEEVVKIAKKQKCKSIAYTYSEPNIFYEYVLETAKLAHQEGIKNVMVTAGYINPEPLRELCKYIDGANIDYKGPHSFYKEYCSATLEPIREAIKIYQEEGVHIEITNLIIPTKNDHPDTIKKMCEWIKNNLGTDVPIHFSRFWPMYKLKNLPPTPIKTLEKARNIALNMGLKYVYIGNIRGHLGENTYCPKCKKLLIQRFGYHISQINLENGRCKFCKEPIKGVWD
jgi:pyruvate formate lyase activating enzyme